MKKSSAGILLALLLTSMLILSLRTQSARASGAIHIRPDGSIDPATASIQRDGDTYTFTGDICDPIVVERDGIVVDGRGFAVRGAESRTGIDLSCRSNVTLRNVEVTNFDVGISLVDSCNCTLFGNSAFSNKLSGINLDISNHNALVRNIVSSNNAGMFLYRCHDNFLTMNTAFNNSLGGIVFYYSSANALVCNNALVNNRDIGWSFMRSGFFFYTSTNNIAIGNTAESNCYGFFLTLSNNNSCTSNMILNNSQEGIYVYYSSTNSFTDNTVSDNECAVGIEYANDNSFFHNNFLDNAEQVRRLDDHSSNEWDDGYPSGGNYWSNYSDEDLFSGPFQNVTNSDGIWDHPYAVDDNNRDNYPLVEPWGPKPATPSDALAELIDTIETWSLPKGTENSLTSKLEGALHLLTIGNENGAVRKLIGLIKQAEALQGKKLLEDKADYLIAEAQKIRDLINE